MRGQSIRRFSIVGDSIAWSMMQSLWKLLELPAGPPGKRPPSKLLRVDCGDEHLLGRAQGAVELQWVSANYLNATVTAEVVKNSDLTVLNAGPWYSPSNGAMRDRFATVQAEPGRLSGGATDASFGRVWRRPERTVSMSGAWRLFVDDLLEVHKALSSEGLPDKSHRLIWRTTHTPHPGCHNYTRPLHSAGDALEGLLGCKECVEAWGWHLYPALDRAARDRLSTLGALVFDVRPMTATRADAHSEHRYAPNKYDCLHLALPGVPDWWAAVLLGTMESCGV